MHIRRRVWRAVSATSTTFPGSSNHCARPSRIGRRALVSLVIAMSSEFPHQAGIGVSPWNADRLQAPETNGFLENPTLIRPVHELFKSPLRHFLVAGRIATRQAIAMRSTGWPVSWAINSKSLSR